MAKVLLNKNRHVEVTLEEANRIERDLADKKISWIKIGEVSYRRGEIMVVDKGQSARRDYDPAKPDDLAVIHEFKALLEGLEKKPLPQAMSYYGQVKEGRATVFNEMLGMAHPSAVQYAIDAHAIHKTNDGWAISDMNPTPHTHDIHAFTDFMAKWKGLKELDARRSYAQDKQIERSSIGAAFSSDPTDAEIDAALE